MAQGRPVSDEQRARIRELHSAGKGRNEIALELGIAAGTITKLCTEMGLSFDRSATAAATTARVIDLKARRTALVERGYKRAEAIFSRLEAESFTTMVKQFGGAEAKERLDFVPTPNERDLAQAISIHLTAAAKLEAQDSDNGADAARSMLADLGRALGLVPLAD